MAISANGPKSHNKKLTLSTEKIAPFSLERNQFNSVSARQTCKNDSVNRNGMNEWIPQPSCMAEPMESKTQSCNISTTFYQRIGDKIKHSVVEDHGLFKTVEAPTQ
jgi:hypothetical protein